MSPKSTIAILCFAACSLTTPLPAAASTTYEYSYAGNAFNEGDNLSGKITLQIFSAVSPTASSLSLTDISSFSITDGTTVITDANYSPASSGIDLSFSGGQVSE